MTLSELRTEFTKKSGRADLTSTEINLYINQGILLLDDLVGFAPFESTPSLVDDTDTNWWSETYPHILVWAALYHLEGDYRNTEGAKDWLVIINTSLTGLDHTRAEEEADGITVMEG